MKRYIISAESASIAVSNMVWTAKNPMQFGIFVFVEAQEINLRDNFQGSKCDETGNFYENFFRFT